MGKKAIIRVDGSQSIGLGHVMRGIALAQGLSDNEIESIFVIKDSDHSVYKTIRRYGFIVERIPVLYDINKDALLTLKIAESYDTRLLITDLGFLITSSDPEAYVRYHQILKNEGAYVITFDVLFSGKLPSDIVINPYYFYDDNFDYLPSGQYLKGSGYFIFRKEFLDSVKNNSKISKEIRKILVSFGGSDPMNSTLMVVRALAHLKMQKIYVRIILGQGYPKNYIPNLKDVVHDISNKFEFIIHSTIMANHLKWADIAILGGGLTKYEAALTGIPSIIITQYQNDILPNIEFAKAGTSFYLGNIDEISENDIIEIVTKINDDYSMRVSMSDKGKYIVDGNGIKRILVKIPTEVFI